MKRNITIVVILVLVIAAAIAFYLAIKRCFQSVIKKHIREKKVIISEEALTA